MLKPIKFTKQGYEELQEEYEKLKKERVQVVQELKNARELGDLSENAAYKVVRLRLSSIDARLRRLEHIIKRATIVAKEAGEIIAIGSEIVLCSKGKEMALVLVDGYESDIAKGKVSVHSPIGKAIRGKRKGDKVKVQTPGGMVEYYIHAVM